MSQSAWSKMSKVMSYCDPSIRMSSQPRVIKKESRFCQEIFDLKVVKRWEIGVKHLQNNVNHSSDTQGGEVTQGCPHTSKVKGDELLWSQHQNLISASGYKKKSRFCQDLLDLKVVKRWEIGVKHLQNNVNHSSDTQGGEVTQGCPHTSKVKGDELLWSQHQNVISASGKKKKKKKKKKSRFCQEIFDLKVVKRWEIGVKHLQNNVNHSSDTQGGEVTQGCPHTGQCK